MPPIGAIEGASWAPSSSPFALFGHDTAAYNDLFAEKLDLLLQIRDRERVTWSGRHRPALTDVAVIPRAVHEPLPVWVGVGGTPGSAERAGRLGLPMTLGYIGGTVAHLRPLADVYRAAGERSGHADKLRLAVSTHLYVGADPATQGSCKVVTRAADLAGCRHGEAAVRCPVRALPSTDRPSGRSDLHGSEALTMQAGGHGGHSRV